MTTAHSPTVGRRRLRHALRDARDAAQLTQEQVADEMDWSLSKVIRIETGVVSISTSDLRQLLQLYRVEDPAQVTELVELARIGRRKPWWTRYKDTAPAQYLSYVGLEDESIAQFSFSPYSLPGLLQTEEFAHAVVDAIVPPIRLPGAAAPTSRLEPKMAADLVDLRMMRQREVLHREHPPQITAILDEAVLWRQIGGPQVLKRQLLHLVALGSRPRLTIRVLPFTAHMVTVLGYFVVLRFADPVDTDVVYTESAFEQTILDRPADVETYRLGFERLREEALNEEESLEQIARVAGELS